nr:2299_t:CDS:2 [Entrophospora candida]
MIWIFKNNSKHQDVTTKNLEKDILELKNEINKINAESEWKGKILSQGHTSKKKNGYSHTKMYDALSREIKLSTGTLSGFYRYQRRPQVPSLDKIETWVNKEEKNKDNIVSSSSNIRKLKMHYL